MLRLRPPAETIGLQHLMIMEPLEFEVLASLAHKDDEVRIVDLILEKKSAKTFISLFQPDLLCLTGYITHVATMIETAILAKRICPSVKVAAGGVHLEVCPADLDHPDIDYRVVRNPVTVFPLLLSSIRSGSGELPPGILRPGQTAEDLPQMDFAWASPRRDLTKRYRRKYFYIFHSQVALMKTAFGCPFDCSFCFCRAITGGAYVQRPLSDVVDELESIAETNIYIVDDDFLVSRERVQSFLTVIRERGIRKKYLLYGRADFIAANPDLIAEFAALGLRTVIVGIESFFEEELTAYNKHTSVEMNEKSLQVLRKNGVDVYATLILPPEWDTKKFRLCGDYLIRNHIKYVNLQPYTPLNGTGMKVNEDTLLIKRQDWAKWDLAHVIIQPKNISVSEYYRQIIKLYQRVLFRPSVLLSYLLQYPPGLLLKMLAGSMTVRSQYIFKLNEARALEKKLRTEIKKGIKNA